MARGKFNKRGGGPRLDAVNQEEIEIRNNRLAELEEVRTQRRAEAEEGEEGEEKTEEAEDLKKESKKGNITKEPKAPAPVTTEADHRRNMSKLAEVRRRREEAESRRKLEEEEEKQQEEELKKMAALAVGEDDAEKKKKKKKEKEEIPKLDKIQIKKMKPATLKDALKERGLDYQGTAKALQERLIAYEAAR